MFCQEPNSPERRPVVLVFAGALLVLSAGCDQKLQEPSPANLQTEVPAAPAQPRLPAPLPALSRGDLVSAAGQAASAYAEGRQASGADPLVGRTFAVRIPFGCTGPATPARQADEQGVASWSWGPEGKTIELRMTPGDWTNSALIAESGAAPAWEAAEGFWIPRPWLASEACPAVKGDPLQTGALPAAPHTIGLAAVFEAGGSRIGRRNGRAYSFILRPEDEVPVKPSPAGYRLALAGRITSFPDGRAIRCRAPGPDQRPVCIIAAKLDRVAFEDAEGETLSDWRPG